MTTNVTYIHLNTKTVCFGSFLEKSAIFLSKEKHTQKNIHLCNRYANFQVPVQYFFSLHPSYSLSSSYSIPHSKQKS